MSMFRPLQPHTSHVMQDCELPGLRKCTFCGRTNLQDDVELPCGHSDREAEITRLTARIAELEKALAESSERVVYYQTIAGKQGTMLMRKDILLKSARQWGVSSRAFNGSVAVAVSDAIDYGEPLHWPSSPFAQKWFSEQGYSNCDGYVGMRFTMKLADDVQIRQDGARTTLEASERGGE